MGEDKKLSKLEAEDLEKRAAPFTILSDTGDPGDTSGGGGGGTAADAEPADQPGNSDGHRNRLFKKIE